MPTPLPSFDFTRQEGRRVAPRIRLLEVREKNQPENQSGGEVLAWIAVEREDLYEYDPTDRQINSASIRLWYRLISPDGRNLGLNGGWFDGSYSRLYNLVSLTSRDASNGAVFLDPPELNGKRIGTYLMNEIVQWVQRWPDASVNPVKLLSGQAQADNKERRNRFYEQFGLVFDYADSEKREGRSRSMLVKDLHTVKTWEENIKEHQVDDVLASALDEKRKSESELKNTERTLKRLITEIRAAEQRPIRWTFMQLYRRYAPRAFICLFFVAVFGMAWLRKH